MQDEPLRSEGVQHATGEERRTSTSRSRADEAAGPKPKGRSVADMHGSERKVQCCKEKYCIGTWNVRTMNLGKLDVVKNEMARINIDILGISELKWTGMGEFSLDDYHIYYCGQETRKRNGVALIVNKRVVKAVLGCNLKNDRMISIRIQGRPFNITVIQVYAPTTGAEETEIDQFYEDLQDLIEVTPKKDVLLIIGDWNAKVGSQEIKGTTGKFGLGVQNEAGQRLIEFCQENKLVITNTLFQQHKRRLYTWTSPDGQHRNQIDYILCSQRWRSSIQSAKTRPGADCGSDHQLLIAKFKLKLKKVGKTTGPVRYNLSQIPYEYTVEVRNRFKDLDLVDRVPEELWMEARNIVQEAATKTIPMKRKCKKAKWLSNEALQIAEERRQAKCEGDSERYRKLNADFQKIARRDKKAFLNKQCKEIEENNRMGKTRDLFKKIGDMKGTFCTKISIIKDKSGKDLTEAEDIKKRWQEYTEKLYQKEIDVSYTPGSVVADLEPDILESEVKWALESIANNKASGSDDIPAELFKILKEDAVKVLHSICQQIWKTQQWPEDWRRSVYIPIPKKGSAKECSNYRTIALISHASKVMLKILQGRLKQYVDRELPEVQAGFRRGRGTRDQIANMRWIMEKAREFQKDIYFCFIDYAKAFDCVDHSKLWQVLKEMGVPDHLICLLRNLYVGQEATVRTGYGTTDWFKIGKGVRQGCILSPCLFNLYAEFIMRKAGLDESQAGIKIAGRNINNLRYADDTTLMAESEEELKNLLMRVKEESAKYGLKLNIKKTKIMATGPITSWQIEGEEMEAVRDFIFLGSMITADGDSSHEIKRRLLLGRKAMANLDNIFKSRDITLPTKVRIVKAMVFPVVMYGSESWTIKKADRRRIDAFELWCWRRLLRVPWTARRSNASILKEIRPECSLEGQIVKLRLQYFGHLMRREDSLEKTLMLGKMEGTRRRGRQRMRWLDSVLEATNMSLTKLREAVEDRSAWRALVHGVTKSRTRLND
uniref:ribonuclease H n=1 Tax=Podarcis muralis TaxID=64176 RepID=A0A670K8R9_PODMU